MPMTGLESPYMHTIVTPRSEHWEPRTMMEVSLTWFQMLKSERKREGKTWMALQSLLSLTLLIISTTRSSTTASPPPPLHALNRLHTIPTLPNFQSPFSPLDSFIALPIFSTVSMKYGRVLMVWNEARTYLLQRFLPLHLQSYKFRSYA